MIVGFDNYVFISYMLGFANLTRKIKQTKFSFLWIAVFVFFANKIYGNLTVS